MGADTVSWNETGPQGSPGVLGFYARQVHNSATIGDGQEVSATAFYDTGDVATDGGIDGTLGVGVILARSTSWGETGWLATVRNRAGSRPSRACSRTSVVPTSRRSSRPGHGARREPAPHGRCDATPVMLHRM